MFKKIKYSILKIIMNNFHNNFKEKNKWLSLKPIDESKIKKISFPNEQYFSSEKDIYNKKQIVLHHTVSGPGIRGDIDTWLSTTNRVATSIIIERDGTVNQLFDEKYWAAHIGAGKSFLDKHSIGIELDNWGQLTKRDNNFYAVYGNKVIVPIKKYLPKFRGEEYFEKYPIAQLKSLCELLLFFNIKYKIPLTYNEDMWDVSQEALQGTPGIWTHVSYRPYPANKSKWDCHPDDNLKEMLKTLSKIK